MLSTDSTNNYKLSAVLLHHTQDVRAVAEGAQRSIFSASRDQTVLSWRSDGVRAFQVDHIYAGHNHFVICLAFIQPSEEFPEGLIVSGSNDKTVNVYDVRNPAKPVFVLVGHTDTVCALAVTADGGIISGSWDKTAIVWHNGTVFETLTGHTFAVWTVLDAGAHGVLTGSADKSIRLWKGAKTVRTYNGHKDVVRALASVPQGFLSASNDSSLRIWTYDGDCIHELSAHTSFVYSIDVLPSGEFVSCGEDRSLRVWRDGQCVETIFHPCTSVWSVKALQNGDIVTGGSDGVVRVFSRSPERFADEATLQEFSNSVASSAVPSNQIGDVDKSKLPGLEALDSPGKPGQVLMVRNGEVVEAHQYGAGGWEKVGEVVDAVSNKQKQIFQGKEYDYVFDVELGGDKLKLPYNANQNPYSAAQDFIHRYELSQEYLDQIANFITQNASGHTISTPSSGYVDPFTGGSRYVPGPSQPPATSSATPSAPSGANAAIPQTSYTSFKPINGAALMTKLKQMNATVGGAQLSTDDLKALETLVSSGFARGAVASSSLGVVLKLLNWPAESRFPGFDLLRVCILDPRWLTERKTTLVSDIFAAVEAVDINFTLAMRCVANLFLSNEGKDIAFSSRQMILKAMQSKFERPSTNKQLLIACTAVISNFAILLFSEATRSDDMLAVDLTSSTLDLLRGEVDLEVEYRLTTALGTLLHHSSECRETARLLDAKSVLLQSKNKADSSLQSVQRVLQQYI